MIERLSEAGLKALDIRVLGAGDCKRKTREVDVLVGSSDSYGSQWL